MILTTLKALQMAKQAAQAFDWRRPVDLKRVEARLRELLVEDDFLACGSGEGEVCVTVMNTNSTATRIRGDGKKWQIDYFPVKSD